MIKRKYLLISFILLIISILLKFASKSLYIIWDYIIVMSIYSIIFNIINPKNKKGWSFFIFVMLVVSFIYISLPIMVVGVVFLTTGKVVDYSYLVNLSSLVHMLLVTIWSILLFICLKNKYPIKKILIFAFAGIHALIFVVFDTNIKEVKYEIDSPAIVTKEESILIAHISDLHSTIYPNEQQYLIDKLKDGNPDLIFLTGDIADDYVDFQGTALLLDGIKDIAPIYYVTGNHEYWDKNFFEVNEQIKSYGVVHLSDAYEMVEVKGNMIAICGIDDPDRYMHYYGDESFEVRLETLNQAVNFDGLKILLSHRPEKVEEYINTDFDIILSGHAHGGQVRIPFLINGLFAPNQGLFPKYAGGEYRLDESKTLFVNRGLSVGDLPRIFNPPEIVYIELK